MAESDFNGRVLLIGAGHAHLHVARQAAAFGRRGVELTLVDPGRFWYSGLATGMLGGRYEPRQDELDPKPVIEQAGGVFIRDALVGLDRRRRVAHLESGERLSYDAISFNIGSRVKLEAVAGADLHAWPVKPISNLHRLRRYLETCFAMGRADRLAVVGGGPTGCEIACNLADLARRAHASPEVTLLTRASRVLPNAPPGASRFMMRWFDRIGVQVRTRTPVERMEARTLVVPNGRLAAELTVIATGLAPPHLLRGFDLPRGDDGGLLVGPTLQSVGDPRVFGAGDCITFQPRPLPKVGVFGVRAAPVLAGNLLRAVAGEPLKPYRPQKTYLLIVNIGRGRGLALRGRWWAQGRWCMRWKDYLDRRFLNRYRT